MDESALQTRLDRIRNRQYLIIALLAVPYLVGFGELVGYATAGVVSAGLGIVALAAFIAHRRRTRDAAHY